MDIAEAADGRAEVGRADITRLLVWIALLALPVPVLLARIPTLVDYPNHLSRLWLLSGGVDHEPVSGRFRASWDTVTNIGFDAAGVALARLLPVEVVGRVLVAVAATLAPLGGVLLWRALHGRWHWWQLAFPLLAWSLGLVFGFLNFEISIGLALLAAAIDPVLGRRGVWWLIPGRMVMSAALLIVHAFAIPFYAVLLGGMAFGPSFRGCLEWDRLSRLLMALLWIGVSVALPVMLLLALAPGVPGMQTNGSLASVAANFHTGFVAFRANPIGKLRALAIGVRAYAVWVDLLTLVVLAAPVAASLWCRKLGMHAGMLLACALLLIAYLLFPSSLAGVAVIDQRFALMLPFAFCAALLPALPASVERAAAALMLGMSLLRTGHVAWVWSARQADVRSVAAALEPVPAGAAVLPLQHGVESASGGPVGRYLSIGVGTFSHLPTLAIPWRQAFVPTLFAWRGVQPIRFRPPWEQLSEIAVGAIASVHALDDPAVSAADLASAPYLRGWRDRFDYVLVVNADMPDDLGPFTPSDALTLIRDEGFAQLYRVNHTK